MPQDIPATCDGCGKKLLIDHSLSCPKGGLVLARHNDAAKEWGALGEGLELGRKGEKPMAERKLSKKPKGAEEGQLTGRLD